MKTFEEVLNEALNSAIHNTNKYTQARAALKMILGIQGLVLNESDEITNFNGKLYAWYLGASFSPHGLDYQIKLVGEINYIEVTVDISSL